MLTSATQPGNGAHVRNGARPSWRSFSVKVSPSSNQEELPLSILAGDNERKLSLPISFLCDRHTINIPESQKGAANNPYLCLLVYHISITGFIGYVVEPLFNMWKQQYNNELSNIICRTLATNKLCWTELCPKESDTDSDDSYS